MKCGKCNGTITEYIKIDDIYYCHICGAREQERKDRLTFENALPDVIPGLKAGGREPKINGAFYDTEIGNRLRPPPSFWEQVQKYNDIELDRQIQLNKKNSPYQAILDNVKKQDGIIHEQEVNNKIPELFRNAEITEHPQKGDIVYFLSPRYKFATFWGITKGLIIEEYYIDEEYYTNKKGKIFEKPDIYKVIPKNLNKSSEIDWESFYIPAEFVFNNIEKAEKYVRKKLTGER